MRNPSLNLDSSITVFDIGCRFGIHPSWRPIKSAPFLRYFAFDVDEDEISRLSKKYRDYPNYKAIHLGFSNKEERVGLNRLAHHGQSSFLRPNLQSIWFGMHRRSDAFIENTLFYSLTTLDRFCAEREYLPDFLKIDAEGYDFRILQGGTSILSSVLAIRCEVHFHQAFEDAETFSDIYRLLLLNGFQLANLDYDGRGVPTSYFCPSEKRYGFITGGEAVFLKNNYEIRALPTVSKLKVILFCFFNFLEDFAHLLLLEIDESERRKLSGNEIWLEIKRQYCLSARKMLYSPSGSYDRAKNDFLEIFGEIFPDKHNFLESEFLNPP